MRTDTNAMRAHDSQSDTDCIVVGASFGGLASAHALATAGLRVTVLEEGGHIAEIRDLRPY